MHIVKVHRQHNSIKITLPKRAARVLGVKIGDYLGIEVDEMTRTITIAKIQGGLINDNRNKIS